MSKGGLSGVALGVMVSGGVLAYAGFADLSPLAALSQVASGKPAPVSDAGANLGADAANAVAESDSASNAAAVALGSAIGNAGLRGAVVGNASKYMGDKYSQPRRQQAGYSDCSSFVDKCLKDAGIAPPFSPWANTVNYLMSPEWKTIPQTAAQPGDIAVATGHMVLITAAGGGSAIGQENSRVNVRTGAPGNLFDASQHYVFKTWTGYAKQAPPQPGTGASVT